jgi:hypothetical protein
MERVPCTVTGTNGIPACPATRKSTEMEPEKPRPPGQRAFRKGDDACACQRSFELMLGVLR